MIIKMTTNQITNDIIQKNLTIILKKLIEQEKNEDNEKKIDDDRCNCMGPAPTIDAVTNVVDTLLTLTTLLIGFTAGTYMMFGYEGMKDIESRWDNWCISNNSISEVLHDYDWCASSRPLSHEFFAKSFWSLTLLGISGIICFAIKMATFIVQISDNNPSGSNWRLLWYIFMFPLLICFLFTIAGLGLFMMTNTLIVRMIYPDYDIFVRYIMGDNIISVWLSSQYIMGGATGFVGIICIPIIIMSIISVDKILKKKVNDISLNDMSGNRTSDGVL
jgi:hypothetical protein